MSVVNERDILRTMASAGVDIPLAWVREVPFPPPSAPASAPPHAAVVCRPACGTARGWLRTMTAKTRGVGAGWAAASRARGCCTMLTPVRSMAPMLTSLWRSASWESRTPDT